MWQAQEKDQERRKRRKGELPDDSYLGHTVKSCMTVIGTIRNEARPCAVSFLCTNVSMERKGKYGDF